MDYIEIDKNLIPYRFDVSLASAVFTFEIHYNSEYDFFTADLERDGVLLASGVRLVYGVPLFGDVHDATLFPAVDIVPYDESGVSDDVIWATLGETVFLFVGGAADA